MYLLFTPDKCIFTTLLAYEQTWKGHFKGHGEGAYY